MPIKYSLIENLLTTDPNDYYPQIQLTQRVGKDVIVDRVLSLGASANRSEISSVLDLLGEAVLGLLLDGYRIDLAGVVDIFPRMQGVFDGSDDRFDRTRHTLGVSAIPSPGFISRLRSQAIVTKEETPRPAPHPIEYKDAAIGIINGPVTKGNIGTLRGSRLKFNPVASDEGIFFVAAAGGIATKVESISTNKPGQLVFVIPSSLKSGEYNLQVRSRMYGSIDVRYGTLDGVLSVP
jgi:hypothetical protein